MTSIEGNRENEALIEQIHESPEMQGLRLSIDQRLKHLQNMQRERISRQVEEHVNTQIKIGLDNPWLISGVFGEKYIEEYFSDKEMNAKTVRELFLHSGKYFYLLEEKNYLLPYAIEIPTYYEGKLHKISAMEALERFSIYDLEKAMEKGICIYPTR